MNLKWVSVLRALGVVLVVVYHFFPAALPGGFIGVDIFFVFSGYLICSLLLQEFEDTERIELPRFYHKRIRRLLPAALFMLLVTLSLLLLISPDFRPAIGRQAAAVLGWCTNYYEIATGQSYENALLPHVFVHTWTLAVEMHFYLIWGAVALVGVGAVRLLRVVRVRRVLRGRGGETRGRETRGGETTWTRGRAERAQRRRHTRIVAMYKGFLLVVVLLLALASYLDMRALALPADDPAVAYFATTSHIFPLFIGAAAALVAGFSETTLTRMTQRIPLSIGRPLAAGALVLVVCLAALLSYADKATYSYGILLVSLLVALFLIVVRGMQTRIGDEPAPIRYVAERSYSIYLFHWPLYIIIEQLLTTNALVAPNTLGGDLVVGLGALIATLGFSELSYRFVEKPLRVSSSRRAPAPREAAQTRFAPASRLILALVVALPLCAFSIQALVTAPRSSFIQQAYEHEARNLSVERLDETSAQLASLELRPLADEGSLGEIYLAEGSTPDGQRQDEPTSTVLENLSASVASDYGSVTVIGDSVVMGAISALRDALGGGYVDAEGNRRLEQIDPLLEQLEQEGLLGEYVILGLATNVFNPESLEGARHVAKTIAPGHRLIFITGYGHDGVLALNETLRELAEKYPYVTVADWYEVATANPELLSGDHIHIGGNELASSLYAECVIDAISRASQKPTS
ncbi:MAG: acyltransferase [Coriobacteriales bacterium]|jgi:peptidoglycan/LPS O-acetylase OafA/YrhL|nr:acyltransferase [Coriobacteriales bacterium]